MKKLSTVDLVAATLVVVAVAFILVPAVARVERSSAEARCQSNLQRWVSALDLYAGDNGNRYPTNRTSSSSMTSNVLLSPVAYDSQGNLVRYVHGVNWVEALYPYIAGVAKRTDQDWLSFGICPNASAIVYPIGSQNSRMTYVMNYNLVEYYRPLVRGPEKVMLLRETDRRLHSACRPLSNCTGSSAIVPNAPLLNESDFSPSTVNTNLHGGGSYVAFVDGHVSCFTMDYFPPKTFYTAANCWDIATQQWYNFGPGSGRAAPYLESIAITP